MPRQHSTPIFIPAGAKDGVELTPVNVRASISGITEADIQSLVQNHPSILPIEEIDPIFINPVAICTELSTPAGYIDNFLVTPTGMPVIVECKLWRNPESRREVVGQILDYAKELSRWSSSDLQREVNRRLGTTGNTLLERVRNVDDSVDEIRFNDALTHNLRRGRFLLLIVGDGIREGVEAISEYLQLHAGLHFSLGLVELPYYRFPNGDQLVVPRILARTHVVTRHVVALPDGLMAKDDGEDDENSIDFDQAAFSSERQQFWTEFQNFLKLDDPEQPIPSPPKLGYTCFMLPAPEGSSWLTVYRTVKTGEVGVFLSSTRDTIGEAAMVAVSEDFDAIRDEIGSVRLSNRKGKPTIADSRIFGDLTNLDNRKAAFIWLAERVNAFVNTCRPRVRSFVADHTSMSDFA